jgi:hypothetical protein
MLIFHEWPVVRAEKSQGGMLGASDKEPQHAARFSPSSGF